MKKISWWSLALSLLLGVMVTRAQTPLTVVATFSILGDVVQQVAGDAVLVDVLVGADSDAHSYEPAPSDAVRLNQAQVIFENGLGFETWLDELYTASGSTGLRVVVSEGIEPLEFADGEHEHAEHEEESTPEATTSEGAPTPEHDHEHGEYDPHIWHNPLNMVVVVENVRNALITADPANKALYTANAEAYTQELLALAEYVQEAVDRIPTEQRILFTNHDTFGYFADAYGFRIDSALNSLSTEAGDPSASDISTIITDIQDTGVKAIFAENISNADLMTQIANSAGVVVAPTLFTDALGAEGSMGTTYVDMVKYNVDTIVQALTQ